ncbi:L-threonylcarbamoyladenylate synthase [Nannocystaceae bacterium ST9]
MHNTAFRVVRRLLPGPYTYTYTMVLKATSDVPRAMKNRAQEVGVRLPNHKICNMLVDLLGEPLLTGSITPGEVEPELEDPEELEERYSREVTVMIDGGHVWPEPSTVLRFDENGDIEVLRVGKGGRAGLVMGKGDLCPDAAESVPGSPRNGCPDPWEYAFESPVRDDSGRA